MGPPFAESLPLVILLGALIVIAMFLAGTEAALLRVSPVKARVLADEGDKRAARVVALVDDLPRVLNTVLLLVLLTQIGAATLAGVIADRHFGSLGVTLASVGLTFLMFVYTEAIPKTIAVRRPLFVARLVAAPIQLLIKPMGPVVGILIWFADLQAPGKGVTTSASVTEAELRRMAADAEEAGAIDTSDFELMERAFRVGDATIGEVVVPRTEVVAVATTEPIASALDIALESGHRRLPVFETDLDEITGVVRLRDLAAAVADGIDGSTASLQRPLLCIPETRRVVDVLRDMQDQGHTIAVVVDEHGGTAGIVTVEDIVEELVGTIADDEGAMSEIHTVGPGSWVVRGSADIDDLEVALGTKLPRGDYHTVAGLIMATTGRIPLAGEELTIGDHHLRVTEASRRRIRLIEIREK